MTYGFQVGKVYLVVMSVVFEREVAVENDSKVADVWGGRQSEVVDDEEEVQKWFQ